MKPSLTLLRKLMANPTPKLTQQQLNNLADARNKNIGTTGTNSINAKVQGNKGKQLNPN
jgi:hypothetical protein